MNEEVAEAARNGHRTLLRLILEGFSEADRLSILMKQCRNGKLPIHHCLSGGLEKQMNALRYLLTCVPKHNLDSLLCAYSCQSYNSLHIAAQHSNHEAEEILIRALPKQRQIHFTSQKTSSEKKTAAKIKKDMKDKIHDLHQAIYQIKVVPRPVVIDNDEIFLTWPDDLTASMEIRSCQKHSEKEIQRRNHQSQKMSTPNATKKQQPGTQRERTPSPTSQVTKPKRIPSSSRVLRNIRNLLNLVKDGKTIRPLLECHDDKGLNPLHLAAKEGREDIIDEIFSAIQNFPEEEKWPLLSSRCESGKTAIHYSAQYKAAPQRKTQRL